ncbi:MAG: LamG-like jellyroll fold domain-containing protein [Caldilineaceae bacterium]
MLHPPRKRRIGGLLALLAAILAAAFALRSPMLANAVQTDPVTAAWEKARAAGSYQFTSDVTQLTIPTAKITNVGRSSRTEQLHLEGQSDLRQRSMEMQLWSDGGSVLQHSSGLGIKISNGKTFVRQAQGDWQEKPDFSVDSLAPQGDFMAYLVALRSVKANAPEQRNGVHFTRYSFTIDGSAFARYVHDQMEQVMRAKGELPADMNLETPRYYQEMTGDGELWVGTNGLPLRQVLHLQFPEQKDEQVQAQMVIDFSHYGAPVVTPLTALRTGDWASFWRALPHAPDALTQTLPPYLLFLVLGLGAVLLFRYRRARLVQNAVALGVIASMVVGPVLTTLTHVSFFDAQTAKAAAQQQTQAAAQTEQDVRAALGKIEFNPQLNPLESGDQRLETRDQRFETGDQRLETGDQRLETSLQSPVSSLSAALPTDNGVDTDGDGLSDFVEQRIGTSPVLSDTDGDGVPDGVEVRGFSYAGKQWYLDPTNADSNGDGLGDAVEWGFNANGTLRATPLDTDGDGIPDLFDPDNDNDGVPDNKDISPFTANTTAFTETVPLQIKFNNLTPNKPAFVEFQVRPQNPKHLWFAGNVLDWPQDSEGQMRDVDAKTYADYAASQGRTPDPNESNGDLKLIPMLEIRLPSASANLPPQSDLAPYNITVNNYTADGATKVVYVPLSVVTDEKTGTRTAFSGQMRYLPTGGWPNPHEVRLVWVVQALTDRPCDPKDPQQVAQGCQTDGYIHNIPQVLQSYYDGWTLTGLTVREDLGAKVAIAYEDPVVDSNKKDDAALWALSFVLDHHFLLGRDENKDGQRDLTVDEITRRFDHAQNSSITDDQRFAVPNILRVSQQNYATVDQAVASTAMTETKKVLTNFNAAGTADATLKPLLLFAQEFSTRQLTLDNLNTGAGYVVQNGASVTMDMAPAGQPAQTIGVTAGLKWSAYCGSATPITWQPCTADAYWAELAQRYGSLPRLPSDASPDWVQGRRAMAQFYYTGFNAGYYGIVQQGAQIGFPTIPLDSAATTTQKVRTNQNGLSTVPLTAAIGFERTLAAPVLSSTATRTNLYTLFVEQARKAVGIDKPIVARDQVATEIANSRRLALRIAFSPLAVAGAVLMVSSQILNLIPNIPPDARSTVAAVAAGLGAAINILMPAFDIGVLAKAGLTATQILDKLMLTSKFAQKAALVGLVISVAVTWGAFFYEASLYKAGSPQLNQAFFGAVAATYFAVFLFLLASTGIGALIAAIIGVIDLILTAICEAGVDALRKVPGLGGDCFTLSGGAIKVLTYLLYNYDSMIDTSRADLVAMGAPTVKLADPSKGYVAGNSLSVSLPVTTTLLHKDPDPSNGLLINLYLYLFSEANLRSSTYQYSLTAPDKQDIVVTRGQMTNAWTVRERNASEGGKYVATTMYRGQANTNPPGPVTNIPLTAGINQSASFYFNMGYAVPAYECWLMPLPFFPFVPPIPVCDTRDLAGNNSTKMDNIKFDVFPATVDGFMSQTSNGDGGLRLAWDARFPTLKDADGDGLLSSVYNGLDPNDNNPDSDNDGLGDSYELQQRQNGVAFSPVSCDTDGDGLTDKQEAQLETDPANPDTDNDGLKDGQEVWHQVYTVTTVNGQTTCAPTNNWAGGWDVRINATAPFTVHVSSNPLTPDSDGDGISDLAEKQLAEAICTAQEVANGRTCEGNPLKPVDNQNQPFNPNVPNTPPIAITIAHDDFDGVLAPGQTLHYTSTVVANTPLAPGVLNVIAPAPPFAAAPAPALLPFNAVTFTSSQTMTVPSTLVVASNPGAPKVVVSSQARTRLPSSTGPAWTFDTVTSEPQLGGFTTPLVARSTGLSANRPDRTDSYLLSSLLSNAATIGGATAGSAGDIFAYSLPSGASRAIENDSNNTAYLRGANAPRSATNNRGDSLVVWDQVDNCRTLNITLLSITQVGADHGTSGIEPYITIHDSVNSQDVRVWQWTSVKPADLGVGTYAQGFPVSAKVCGDYTISAWESGNGAGGDTLLSAQTINQGNFSNLTLDMSGSGSGIFIDVNTPYRDDYIVAGALVGPDGAVKQNITFPAAVALGGALTARRSFNPVVATDSTNFLVGYELRTNNGFMFYATQPVAADGTLGSAGTVTIGSGMYDTQSRLALALTWVGSSYRTLFSTGDGTLKSIDHSSSGVYNSTSLATLATDSATTLTPPSLAWDPSSGRWALAYIRSGSPATVRINGYPNAASTTSDANATFTSPYKQLALAWNPLNRGWLFQGQLTTGDAQNNRQVFVALDNDLVQRATNATQTAWAGSDTPGLALACPAFTALPVLDLRMEELPGATNFVDSASNGNNVVCGSATQCPTAGAPGGVDANNIAIGVPASDYALTFNGNQYLRIPNNATLNFDNSRSFTWLTWVKTAVGSPIMRKGLGGVNDLLLSITNDTGRLRMGFGNPTANTLTATGPDLRDNRWHQVAVTLNRATGTATLYVDGATRGSGNFTGSFVTTDDLFIGSGSFLGYTGALDNLQIYQTALGADTISALYSRTLPAYCVGSTPTTTGNGVLWAKLNVHQPDLRGGAITASNSVSLTVDSDAPSSSLTSVANNQIVQGGIPSAPRILIIGGAASDPTSSVAKVEVSVNNGPWQVANGAASWTFALPLADGAYQIRTRATDVVGNVETPGAGLTLYADGIPPQMSLDSGSQQTAFQPVRNADGRYIVTLFGSVIDQPGTSPTTVSGLTASALQVQLLDAQGQAVTAPQVVTNLSTVQQGSGYPWRIDYLFPNPEKAPAGYYSARLLAHDNAGNQIMPVQVDHVLIDGLGPVATLNKTNVSSGAFTTTLTDTVTIGGQISETLGVQTANVSFTPLQQVLPYSDTVLLLPLDEPARAVFFPDSSTQFNHARCGSPTQCPGSGFPGRMGNGLLFDGNEYLRVRNHPTLNFATNSSFSWQAWVKTNATLATNPIMRKGLGGVADLMLSINNNGQAEMGFGNLSGANRLFAGPNLRDNQWHQVTMTFKRPSNQATLYVDGVSYGSGVFPGNFTTPDDLFIGSGNFQGYIGSLDQVAIFRHALSAAEVQALFQAASRPTYPATILRSPTGEDTGWTRQAPAGLEGIYQIDLPALDVLGNKLTNGNLWRGIIDTTNPRVTLTGRATGAILIDPTTNTTQFEVRYTCRAEDWQLKEAAFTCAGNGQQPPTRSFNQDPLLKQQFPDLSLLTVLTNTYTLWQPTAQPSGAASACDVSGHCTTATASASVASVSVDSASVSGLQSPVSTLPNAVIIDPADGSVVNSSGAVVVAMNAQAAQPLKEVALLLDDAVVATVPLAQRDAITRTFQTVSINVATPGQHKLAARATDWTGAVQTQLTPVNFTLVNQAPAVTLDTTQVSKADTYALQSGILRFRGTVSSSAGLAAVKVKVGNQPFADADFGNGQWRIAYPVKNPEGQTLTVIVQAIDRSGQVTQISGNVGTSLTSSNVPDTQITAGPANPTADLTASFTFNGGTGSQGSNSFTCQLDDSAFAACTSPVSYSNLDNGVHTFQVRASDAQGFVGPTPASFTWTVHNPTLETVLTASPTNPSSSRTASFTFNATGASSFTCALDGAAYSSCSSPQSYSRLPSGSHTFQVRAKNNGGQTGPATRFTWVIAAAAPVAQDQVVTTVENRAVAITLGVTGNEAQSYRLVDRPAHGVLFGVPPTLTYTPNSGYAGPDRFTFRANGGESESNLATVAITVRLGKYAVFAQEGVAFEQNAAVVRGDVGVNIQSAGPFLRNNVEASFAQNSTMQDPTSRMLADSIVVDNNAVIANPSYNDLTGKGTVNGTRTTPLALPLRSGLPALPTITPGPQAVTVNGSQTLAAGSYGALTINNGATLILSGGVYHFASGSLSQNAKVLVQAPSEVRIAGTLAVSQNAYIGPDPAIPTMNANQIVIEVAGTNGQAGVPDSNPKAASFDQNSQLFAYLVAPNGTVVLSQNAAATGAVIGKWVLVLQNGKVTRPVETAVKSAGKPDAPVIVDQPVVTATEPVMTAAVYLPVVMMDAVLRGGTVDSGTASEITATTPLTISAPLTVTLPATTTSVLTTTSAPQSGSADSHVDATKLYLPWVAATKP